jgi:CRISPR-associated protein Csm4
MPYDVYRCRVEPLSDFGTPLVGDTLFGHLCWALRWRHGAQQLAHWLTGYPEGRPFAVVSDALPAGWLPRPTVGLSRLALSLDPATRKADKKRTWLPADGCHRPLPEWLSTTTEQPTEGVGRVGVLTQNTIDRLSGTTGAGMFAPRQVERVAYSRAAMLEIHVVVDNALIEATAVFAALEDIGAAGYGRDASTGLGKFRLVASDRWQWPSRAQARHGITLAPCAPCTDALDASDSHYLPVTRFGRHGSTLATAGQPFKKPVLLARTGALLAFRDGVPPLHGRGIGGACRPLSEVEPATVHQGYAPIVPVVVPPVDAQAGERA